MNVFKRIAKQLARRILRNELQELREDSIDKDNKIDTLSRFLKRYENRPEVTISSKFFRAITRCLPNPNESIHVRDVVNRNQEVLMKYDNQNILFLISVIKFEDRGNQRGALVQIKPINRTLPALMKQIFIPVAKVTRKLEDLEFSSYVWNFDAVRFNVIDDESFQKVFIGYVASKNVFGEIKSSMEIIK